MFKASSCSDGLVKKNVSDGCFLSVLVVYYVVRVEVWSLLVQEFRILTELREQRYVVISGEALVLWW